MQDVNSKRERIKELTDLLNRASKAYYAEDAEIMDNLTYDRLYDELAALEEETNIRYADSPTIRVGYEAVDELPKMQHERPMLSLDKTKDPETLRSFIGENRTLLSWKMDGLTIVLTYTGGELSLAVTRGDGRIGEVVTPNARAFKDLPLSISFKGELILRGEAYITYEDFEEINRRIEDADAKYKNPRNLCSGSVRQLNSEVTAARNVRLKAFSLVKAEGVDFHNSHKEEFEWLKAQGFDVVEFREVTKDTLDEAMEYFKKAIAANPFPSDGLVALYDDIAYGESLGTTAKFPRNSFAFKWADEQRATHLKEIEWSPSRTGLINPIAVFEPVELEGTTVSRASVHNLSIMEELALGEGDEILVYKANMIIPQIAENRTRSGSCRPPEYCPVCGSATHIKDENGVKTLFCGNPDCPAKAIKSFALFVGREAVNIEGISVAILEKLIGVGLISTFADIFRLKDHRDEITEMDGFGEKSFEKLTASIEKARKTTLARLICGLGIPNIGTAAARLIANAFDNDPEKVMDADVDELIAVEGIGELTAGVYKEWWAKEKNREAYRALLDVMEFEKPEKPAGNSLLAGKTFVITGSLNHYENRNALKEYIENAGGKVAGSVSRKTDYLINNDAASASSKNRTAAELGIPVITEDEFNEKFT